MNKKIKIDKAQKASLKNIDTVYSNLNKKLPTFPDFFLVAVLNGFAEKVNLKKLYPELYKQAYNLVEDINKNAIHSNRKDKFLKTNKLLPIYQYYLKTESKRKY